MKEMGNNIVATLKERGAFAQCLLFILLLAVSGAIFSPTPAFATPNQSTLDSCDELEETKEPDAYLFSQIYTTVSNRIWKVSCYVYAYIADDASDIIALLMVIYLSIFGIMMVLGLSQISAADAIMHLLKIALIWIFATSVPLGFKFMGKTVGSIMNTGIALATSTEADSVKFECLGAPLDNEFSTFVNIECIFLHMAGLTSTNTKTKAYYDKHQLCEEKFERFCTNSAIGSTVSSTCSTQAGDAKDGWMAKCVPQLTKLWEMKGCTTWEKNILGGCLHAQPYTNPTAVCEKMRKTCQMPLYANNTECTEGGPTDEKANVINACIGDDATDPGKVVSWLYVAFALLLVYVFGPILCAFALMLLVLIFYLFARAILGLLLVITTLALLMATSAVFLSLGLFESTKEYFDKWVMELANQVIQPFVLFAGLVFFNNLLWGQMEYFTNMLENVLMYEKSDDTSSVFGVSFSIPEISYDKIPRTMPDGSVVYPYTKENLPPMNLSMCWFQRKKDPTDQEYAALYMRCDKMCGETAKSWEVWKMFTRTDCTLNCVSGKSDDYGKFCEDIMVRKAQAFEFGKDTLAMLTGMIILVFAAIAYVENVGTIVRITATTISKFGPNMAPTPANFLKAGASTQRRRQYADSGIEGAGRSLQRRIMGIGGRGTRQTLFHPMRTMGSIMGAGISAAQFADKATQKHTWKTWKRNSPTYAWQGTKAVGGFAAFVTLKTAQFAASQMYSMAAHALDDNDRRTTTKYEDFGAEGLS